jgi:LacI family transcriptional regulator
MAVRLKDIAESLNVSIVTVSKVLNGNTSISESMRAKVVACAHQLGYRTNLTAKSLVTGKSRMIGLIVPDLFHGFFSEIAASMSDELRVHSYGLLIASSREDGELERNEVEQMLARNVDALVVASCKGSSKTLKSAASEIPVVLLDRRLDGDNVASYVGTNNLLAGELATRHLLAIGRKRIAHIGGPLSSPAHDRETAYRRVLGEHGIRLPSGFVVKRAKNEESSPVTGAQAMRKLLKLKTRPDSVFCYNDPTAIGAMAAILEAGLRIPEDVAVVGCGNIQHAAYTLVPLTSVDQNTVQLGKSAASLAINNVERTDQASISRQETVIEPKLVIRGSSRKEPHV